MPSFSQILNPISACVFPQSNVVLKCISTPTTQLSQVNVLALRVTPARNDEFDVCTYARPWRACLFGASGPIRDQ